MLFIQHSCLLLPTNLFKFNEQIRISNSVSVVVGKYESSIGIAIGDYVTHYVEFVKIKFERIFKPKAFN